MQDTRASSGDLQEQCRPMMLNFDGFAITSDYRSMCVCSPVYLLSLCESAKVQQYASLLLLTAQLISDFSLHEQMQLRCMSLC